MAFLPAKIRLFIEIPPDFIYFERKTLIITLQITLPLMAKITALDELKKTVLNKTFKGEI